MDPESPRWAWAGAASAAVSRTAPTTIALFSIVRRPPGRQLINTDCEFPANAHPPIDGPEKDPRAPPEEKKDRHAGRESAATGRSPPARMTHRLRRTWPLSTFR